MSASHSSGRFMSLVAAFALANPLISIQAREPVVNKPTVVLVHGAFAESSSWNPVVTELQALGYPTIAAANPLRSVKGDANYVSSIVSSVSGPVVLVGHSYGGLVISNAVNGNANVKALVYVGAFAPDKGETAFGLSSQFPGSTLGGALAPPVVLPDGGKDFYIQQDKLHSQFAADLTPGEAKQMAATQRPVTEAALNEASGEPAWKSISSWFIYGVEDKNIPAAALGFMANRAGARKTVAIPGASHVVMLSHPKEVARMIDEAAKAAVTPAATAAVQGR
jgi:pimeloyl-ACP methyl ester carboxylesterase